MALTTSKVSSNPASTNTSSIVNSQGIIKSLSRSRSQSKVCFHNDIVWPINSKPLSLTISRRLSSLFRSRGTRNSEAKGGLSTCEDRTDSRGSQIDEEDDHRAFAHRSINSTKGLEEACKFVYNDAKYVNKRARTDIVLLSRGIMRLDERARQDVAILGSGFLKLDARAREDTEKLDRNVKRKAERLHHIAKILKDIAGSRLKTAADKHWSDGALEADLRRADFRAKQRAMEDALMALQLVKNIHDLMFSRMYKFPLGSEGSTDMMDCVTLEKNGINFPYFPGEVSTDRITAIQEAYWSMASAFSEADGIDYTDPEELELLVTTLIDLDAMDGKSSVSLLAECSSSPDVSTRQALANALAVAPSMWTLGNAGMGALQRLSEDSNPAIAAAASKAIFELKKQWEIEEGDSWRFMVSQTVAKEETEDDEE